MRRKIIWKILLISISFLLAACGQNSILPTNDSSQNQPEQPIIEPYPSSGQENPDDESSIDLDTTVSNKNPYPEPQEPLKPDWTVGINDHEFAPAPGDNQLIRSNVFIDSNEVLLLESFPVQVKLHITGSLPTPCHQLRVISAIPDKENKIQIETYSLADPDVLCMQVLEPFEVSIPLGNFSEGKFTVWLNGEQVGEFNLN